MDENFPGKPGFFQRFPDFPEWVFPIQIKKKIFLVKMTPNSFYPPYKSHTVFDAAISRLMTSVHSKLVQSRQYALLKTTSQRRCISNVRHDPGYGLDAVTT
jgi:hypothetical protein